MTETQLHVATFDQLDPRTLYSILKLRSDVFIVEQECAYQDLDGRDDEAGTRHIWLTTEAREPLAYLRVLQEPDGTAIVGRVVVAAAATPPWIRPATACRGDRADRRPGIIP